MRAGTVKLVKPKYLVVGLGNPGPKYKDTRHNVGFLVVDELLRRHNSLLDGVVASGRRNKKSKKSQFKTKAQARTRSQFKTLRGQVEVIECAIPNPNSVGGSMDESVRGSLDSGSVDGGGESIDAESSGEPVGVVLAKPHTFMNLSGKAVKFLASKYNITDYQQLIIVHDELDLKPGQVKQKFGGGTAGHKGLNSITTSIRSKDFWRVRVGIGKPPSAEQGADFVLSKINEPEIVNSIQLAANMVAELVHS